MLPTEPLDILEVTDVRAIRALAHPVRLAILERVRDERSVTATECAELTGESPQACSYHLRHLAKWGFVRRVAAEDGRETRWGAAARSFRFSGASREIGPAAEVLRDHVLQRDERALAEYLRREHELDEEWSRAAHFVTATIHVTADELRALETELGALLAPYRRPRGERPEASRPVRFLARAFLELAGEPKGRRST